jgi:hypothetical protein
MSVLAKWYPNFANNEHCADEILALPLYPEEFIEWKDENVGYLPSEGKFWCSDKNKIIWFKTINELYEHWKNLSK